MRKERMARRIGRGRIRMVNMNSENGTGDKIELKKYLSQRV